MEPLERLSDLFASYLINFYVIVSWRSLFSSKRPTVTLTDKLNAGMGREFRGRLYAKTCYQSAILTTMRKDLRDNPGLGDKEG